MNECTKCPKEIKDTAVGWLLAVYKKKEINFNTVGEFIKIHFCNKPQSYSLLKNMLGST